MGTTNGPSERSTVRRLPQRAAYGRAEVVSILDEGLVCHVGLVEAGFPRLIPMAYVRRDDRVIVHGNQTGRRQFVSITPDRAFDRMVNNAYPVGN